MTDRGMSGTMRAARLHGVGDLRVETLPRPEPGLHELLVRVEACGICPTDVRKHAIGSRDGYPLNPGHEWVGVVEAGRSGRDRLEPGDRVYGDTYAGYAEYALLPVEPAAWSNGALAVPADLDAVRATFVEPLADCVHAVRDQAAARAGSRICVVGAGQMGLQIVAVAAGDGAVVTVVEPQPERRELALAFGAPRPRRRRVARRGGRRLRRGDPDDRRRMRSSRPASARSRQGGRVVLFAGFGDAPQATLDLDVIHYREVSLVGSEWIGTPPNQRRERYADALEPDRERDGAGRAAGQRRMRPRRHRGRLRRGARSARSQVRPAAVDDGMSAPKRASRS